MSCKMKLQDLLYIFLELHHTFLVDFLKTEMSLTTGGGLSLLSHFRRRVSSVVEHSSANPKVPGSIPGLVSYRRLG